MWAILSAIIFQPFCLSYPKSGVKIHLTLNYTSTFCTENPLELLSDT